METITIAPKAKRSGMIMPLVATIVVFIFLIGIAMLKIGFGSRFIAARTSSEIAARSAADAGLTMAMHLMTPGISTPSPLNNYKLNDRTTFFYEVTEVTSDPIRRFLICSTGERDHQISRTVYAMTWATSFWSYAIAVDDTITLKPNMVLDVWDPYGNYPNFTPDIATTSTEPGAITLSPNTNIPGDIVVGAGSDVDSVVSSKKTSTINGDVYAADSDIEFPDVTLPEGLPPLALWPGDPCSVLDTGLYAYSSINLGAGAGDKLKITGNVVIYVAGPMRLHNGAELYIEGEDSSLSLYLGGWFLADNSAKITNQTKDATKLRMYGTPTCTSIEIKSKGEFWGAVYAPSAVLLIYNDGVTYGSFIGKSFEMKNSGEFYYDARLLDIDPTGEPSFFRIERWWER